MPDYICQCCDYKTSNLYHYNKHLMTSGHAINKNNNISEDDSNSETKMVKCEYCNNKLMMTETNQQLKDRIKYLEQIIVEQHNQMNALKRTLKFQLTNITNSI